MEALDLLSNNLANASSPGFKADRESYSTYRSVESDMGEGAAMLRSPVIEENWTDMSQGALTATGNASEFALSGSGFFVVRSASSSLLSRGGTIRASRDGKLETSDGYEFAAVEPEGIRVDPGRPFAINAEGTVVQDGVPLGRLKIVSSPSPEALSRRQGMYFRIDTAGMAQLGPSEAEVRQGYIEQTNLGSAEASARLIGILRQFEGLQKAIHLGSEMNRRAVEEVARVQP